MTILHAPGLWALIVLIGVAGLAADAAWRSWRFGYPIGDALGVPVVTGNGQTRWTAPIDAEYTRVEPPPGAHVGATEAWSPTGEVAGAGRSLEDWLSERLQAYDEQLRRIESMPRLPDGRGAYAVLGRTTAEELAAFVAGSQRLGAYRSFVLETTGGFSRAELDEILAPA